MIFKKNTFTIPSDLDIRDTPRLKGVSTKAISIYLTFTRPIYHLDLMSKFVPAVETQIWPKSVIGISKYEKEIRLIKGAEYLVLKGANIK